MTMSTMPETETIDYFRGSGERGLAFCDLDQHYRLKHRAFIEICMSPVFEELETKFRMLALRQKGIVPIMFYLDFHASRTPIAFGRKVSTEYAVSIHRTESENGAPRRLLLDMRAKVKAHRGSGSASALGFEKEKGPLEEVGGCQVLQVFTRPLAPAGERGITELPQELEAFNVRPWEAPYPTVDRLLAGPEGGSEPQGWAEPDTGDWRESTSVWGMPNTDVNQHINVEEYIAHMENHASRLLHAAGLPLTQHHHGRVQVIFRRPCFPGDLFGLRGRLWIKDGRTVCVTGLHDITSEGQWSPRPNVAARFEGEVNAE